MSIALDPIVKGYYLADSDHADPAGVTQNNLAGSRTTIESRTSDRITTVGLQIICTLSVLAVSGALLTFAGWWCFEFLASLQAQLESLSTTQLLQPLAGA